MKKQILTILAITFCLTFLGGIIADTINLDNTNMTCLGTDCEYVSTASGIVTIANCKDTLHMDVDLSGLEKGNYQLSLQTYSNDKRLDSTNVCANPNAPMDGNHSNAWECGSWEDYSFFNFDMDAIVGDDGNFQKTYDVNLQEGYYNMILLIKHDKVPEGIGGENYPIVLQKDHLTFSISNSCSQQFQDRVIALENRVNILEQTCSNTCTNSTIGKDGLDGKSAYEIWLNQNNTGTIQDFLNSLIGKDGTNGNDGYTPIEGVDYFNGINGSDASVNLTTINEKLSYFDNAIETICKIPVIKSFCNKPPVATEDCTTKANDYFCDYRNYSVRKDYYNCKTGQGTATNCNIGKCNYITGHVLCNKCNVNTGKC